VSRRVLAVVAGLALAVAGAVVGVTIYASTESTATTTTIVDTVSGGTGSGQPIAASSGLTATQIYRDTYRGVVDIKVALTSSSSLGRAGSQESSAEGSGFVYDAKGDILTNEHVIDGATSINVRFWNGVIYKGRLVGSDRSSDLAVVKVSAPSSMLHPLTLASSGAVQVGDGVLAIGSPFGLPESMTSGIVSALHRDITSPNGFTISDVIQTDAPINHGNSGGPLLNAAGQVIGVNTQIQTESGGGSEGVGFAVPSNTIQLVATKLAAGKKVAWAYLGIEIQDASTATDASAGAQAGDVAPGTPAARAGLKQGDVIVRMGGAAISSAEDLGAVLDSKQPGDTIKVTYLRGGKTHTVTVTLGTRPS
jgi:putative serine protease PepD